MIEAVQLSTASLLYKPAHFFILFQPRVALKLAADFLMPPVINKYIYYK